MITEENIQPLGSFKEHVSKEIRNISKNSRFLRKVRNNSLSKSELGTYLYNIRWTITHTYPNLLQACEISKNRSNYALADFFSNKALEEQGHERWAEKDMEHLGINWLGHDILPSFKTFQDIVRENLLINPISYLVYAYLVEALTVELGPEFLKSIYQGLGIRPDQISVVSNHIEADEAHVEENSDAFPNFVQGEQVLYCTEILRDYATRLQFALDSVVTNEKSTLL